MTIRNINTKTFLKIVFSKLKTTEKYFILNLVCLNDFIFKDFLFSFPKFESLKCQLSTPQCNTIYLHLINPNLLHIFANNGPIINIANFCNFFGNIQGLFLQNKKLIVGNSSWNGGVHQIVINLP